ncbi:MAG: FecR domain-containing protein [Tannerellaceae bacterium]|jgi:ferric-dicitrate binding protein FerR (iron transport regulator)|nr:FecR domain-containing protein [Tannerellaceae bacterium]
MNSINKDKLLLYVCGRLTPKEEEEVESWMEISAENKKIVEELYLASKITDQLLMMKSVDPEKSLAELYTTLDKTQSNRNISHYLKILQRVAAILFIPVFILAALWFPYKQEKEMQYVEIKANKGTTSSLTLPDNTVVWLNAGSKITYPVNFSPNHRSVRLEGEGFFEVSENPEKPFIVKSDSSYSVKVLGTSFNVSAYSDDEYIETTLISGSVQINYLFENQKNMELLLKPNEKAIYSKMKKQIAVVEIEANQATAWIRGQIVFNNHSMADVFKILSRHYNAEFRVLDQRVSNSALTGLFYNEPLSQVMKYIEMATGIKYRITPSSENNKNEHSKSVVELFL